MIDIQKIENNIGLMTLFIAILLLNYSMFSNDIIVNYNGAVRVTGDASKGTPPIVPDK